MAANCKRFLPVVLFLVAAAAAHAQPSSSGSSTTNGFRLLTTDPTLCNKGRVLFNTTVNLFKGCNPANTWATFTIGGYVAGGTDVAVADGGTGRSTATAFAPIFGGTTATGAFQSGTAGTAGQVLTSNGAGVLPSFQASGAGLPAVDTTSLVEGSADATKEVRLEVDTNVPTGTVVELTVPAASGSLIVGATGATANTLMVSSGTGGATIGVPSGNDIIVPANNLRNDNGITIGKNPAGAIEGFYVNTSSTDPTALVRMFNGTQNGKPNLMLIKKSGQTAYPFGIFENDGTTKTFQIDTNGHILTGGAGTPSVAGSCGTSPSVAGEDNALLITAGTVAPTSCAVTFGVAFANAPVCTANAETTTTALNVVTTTTTVTVSAAALTASEKIYVLCTGY